MKSCIFGPVPSRRLGLSLGIDLTPHKTCSLDCIYCECGKTTNLTITRKIWRPTKKVLAELSDKLKEIKSLDYITFSGAGEPTLSKNIGCLIRKIKKIYNIPICVLTNSMLLTEKKVVEDLLTADIVIPSLDAATAETFKIINRPIENLDIENIIQALIDFRKLYKNKLFLEILLVKDINNSPEELKALSKAADKIKPDKIQLNTCVRPGTENNIRQLSFEELNAAAKYFNFTVDIISAFSKNKDAFIDNESIINLIKRRPCTIADISAITSLTFEQVLEKIELLKARGIKIIEKQNENGMYYFIEQI